MKQKRPSAFRNRKHIPYGSKGYCGFGGEFYSSRHRGYYITDIVNKRQIREKNKMKEVIKDIELENENLNDSAYKEDQESDPDLD